MENLTGWPTTGPDRMRCPRCGELHTAWVLVEARDRKTDLVVWRECRYCEYGVEVLTEMGVPITRAEDRADAEGRNQ